MKVRQGWSGEVEPNRWAKFDIEVDEIDLIRILVEAGIPVEVGVDLPTATVFQILENEAERLVLVKLITRYNYPQAEGAAKVQKLAATRHQLLEAVSHSSQADT